MAYDVPENEPQELIAGDTWKWTRGDLADYPASTWTLTYYFTNASANFSFAATADGDNYAVTVAKATTAAYAAGLYEWEAYVTDGTSRHRVDYGSLQVRPDLEAAGTLDRRSHWAIVLDNVEPVIQNRATKDQLSFSIGNRSLQRMAISDLLELYGRAKAEVAQEEARDRARNGLANRSRIRVRFV